MSHILFYLPFFINLYFFMLYFRFFIICPIFFLLSTWQSLIGPGLSCCHFCIRDPLGVFWSFARVRETLR